MSRHENLRGQSPDELVLAAAERIIDDAAAMDVPQTVQGEVLSPEEQVENVLNPKKVRRITAEVFAEIIGQHLKPG